MATTVLVGQVDGQAWMRTPDGDLVPLIEGMRVPADAEIVTAQDTAVELVADGRDPIVVGGGRELALAREMFTSDPSPESNSIQDLADADAERVIAALEAGLDPFEELEATAATRISRGLFGGGHTGVAAYTRVL